MKRKILFFLGLLLFSVSFAKETEKLSFYIVDDYATNEFNELYNKEGKSLFDENGNLIQSNFIPNDKQLIKYENLDFQEKKYYVVNKNSDLELEATVNISILISNDLGITFDFSKKNAKKIEKLTENNIDSTMAIVFKGKCCCAAKIIEKLSGGSIVLYCLSFDSFERIAQDFGIKDIEKAREIYQKVFIPENKRDGFFLFPVDLKKSTELKEKLNHQNLMNADLSLLSENQRILSNYVVDFDSILTKEDISKVDYEIDYNECLVTISLTNEGAEKYTKYLENKENASILVINNYELLLLNKKTETGMNITFTLYGSTKEEAFEFLPALREYLNY